MAAAALSSTASLGANFSPEKMRNATAALYSDSPPTRLSIGALEFQSDSGSNFSVFICPSFI